MKANYIQEILVRKVFIYKIINKNLSPHKRMEINQRLMSYINENRIEFIDIFEDHISTSPSERNGLNQIIGAYEEYINNNVVSNRIDYLTSVTGIKVLVASEIDQLGINILDSIEVLEKLTGKCQVLFI